MLLIIGHVARLVWRTKLRTDCQDMEHRPITTSMGPMSPDHRPGESSDRVNHDAGQLLSHLPSLNMTTGRSFYIETTRR